MTEAVWIKTAAMAAELGCHRQTLARLKAKGFFTEGHHYRKINPTAPRGDFIWHRARVLLRMGAT